MIKIYLVLYVVYAKQTQDDGFLARDGNTTSCGSYCGLCGVTYNYKVMHLATIISRSNGIKIDFCVLDKSSLSDWQHLVSMLLNGTAIAGLGRAR